MKDKISELEGKRKPHKLQIQINWGKDTKYNIKYNMNTIPTIIQGKNQHMEN